LNNAKPLGSRRVNRSVHKSRENSPPTTWFHAFSNIYEARGALGSGGGRRALYRCVIGNAAANPKEDETMKNLTKNMMIAAAALAVAAGVAQAQTIKAEVPFSFRVAGTAMPAGEYRVESKSGVGGPIFWVVNADAHRSIVTIAYLHNYVPSSGDPKLTFECSGANCALVQMSSGQGATYGFTHPSLGRDEPTRVAVIRAVMVKTR
jgi:hypothetical protein